ncbi:MAG TPA: hypothetical protein VJR92_00555 [Gemmatimonadaceae bacterium]|nr:hypothetical protein [Gemmatimonadaceae bacterium]
MRLLLVLPVAVATASAQQAVPTRTLAKPDIEYSEPFSQLVGIRELKDGRVIVGDTRDRTLQVIDLAAGRATPIGREGSGPDEWLSPQRVLAWPGDSTVIFDPQNNRMLVVGPNARPARSFDPSGAPPGAPGAGRGGVAGAGAGAGAGGRNVQFRGALIPRGTDSRGRIYSQGAGVSIGPDFSIVQSDTAPIVRFDPSSNTHDTVAYVHLAPRPTAPARPIDAGGGRQMMVFGTALTPFAPADDWNVTSDGQVVIARVADYRIDVVGVDGKTARGTPTRFTPVPVTEQDKENWRRAQQAARAGGSGGVRVNIGGETRTVPLPPTPEPTEWPATKPPFQNSSVWSAPNGEVWVLRTGAASDKTTSADVFNAQGRHVSRVVFPERTRLVGFGTNAVYLVRTDDDDLLYLQRHALTSLR